jgi:hypothetical protein
MQCSVDYVQQFSTALNTLHFCSALCELKNMFPIEPENSHTESKLEALENMVCDLLEAHGLARVATRAPDGQGLPVHVNGVAAHHLLRD